MKYKKKGSAHSCGRFPEKSDNPMLLGVPHPKLGRLSWKLADGTIVVCKAYTTYELLGDGSGD